MIFTKHNHILEEKTKEFVQALIDSPEYLSLKKAREEFENDEDAKKLFKDFQETQQTYAIFRQGGFPGIEAQEKRLRELQRRLQQNRKINNLIICQRDFQIFVSDIIDEISRKINFPFAPQQIGGGCCG